MDRLTESLKGVEKRLSDQLERRDRLLKESRDVISSCSRTIIDVHGGKRAEAGRELARARTLLRSLKKLADGPVTRYLISPETEFVEASAVYALAKGGQIPSREALDASPEAYLLGLLDTVGELKRLILDSIMDSDIKKAKRFFDQMESLYSACSPLAVYDHVVNGTRRKIDVARMLVEDTRGLLMEEVRREMVKSSMDRVYKKLGSVG
ncbi:MAG: RNA-binding protein [Nitrososphaerales archaeon]|nr:RNA-binding protein [Nitrososphaerales archaeon]